MLHGAALPNIPAHWAASRRRPHARALTRSTELPFPLLLPVREPTRHYTKHFTNMQVGGETLWCKVSAAVWRLNMDDSAGSESRIINYAGPMPRREKVASR